MPNYKARTFEDGQIFYASDINIIENQLELLSTKLNALSLASNIWIDIAEPEDKSVLWIDLGDNANNISGELNEILNEYSASISFLTEEIKKLKQIIEAGGVITPPDIPDEPIITDTNNYMLLDDTGLMLLMEDGTPFLLENDFENNNEETIQISNAIIGEDNMPIITEDNCILLTQ